MPSAMVSEAPPFQAYAADVIWPAPSVQLASGAAFAVNGLRGGSAVALIWANAVGAGANTMLLDANGDWDAIYQSDGIGAVVSRSCLEYKAYLALFNTGFVPAYRVPSWHRVCRWQVKLRTLAATPALYTFAGWQTEGTVTASATPEVAGTRWFGIMGDGAGNWVWVSRNAGGAGYAEIVPLGLPQAPPTVFDFVLLCPTPRSNARAQIWANQTLLIDRAFGPGSVLPDYASPANSSHFVPIVGARDVGVATTLLCGRCRFAQGHYNVDGTEVTGA